MADKLGLDGSTRNLKLGKSFDKSSTVAFHSIRYDFKPASVDTSKVSAVDVGENHSVTVTVPHVEGSGTSHTVYKGNKRPCQKECVLIIDHNTGEITLEKLANTIHLKKTRSEFPPKLQQSNRPITPSDHKTSPKKKGSPSHSAAPNLPMNAPLLSSAPVRNSPKQTAVREGDSSSNSSSSGSESSSSDEEEAEVTKRAPEPVSRQDSKPKYMSTLSEDLRLSESGSDSD